MPSMQFIVASDSEATGGYSYILHHTTALLGAAQQSCQCCTPSLRPASRRRMLQRSLKSGVFSQQRDGCEQAGFQAGGFGPAMAMVFKEELIQPRPFYSILGRSRS